MRRQAGLGALGGCSFFYFPVSLFRSGRQWRTGSPLTMHKFKPEMQTFFFPLPLLYSRSLPRRFREALWRLLAVLPPTAGCQQLLRVQDVCFSSVHEEERAETGLSPYRRKERT